MFTQLDNDGWKFMVAYANYSNKTKAKYNSYEGDALLLFGQIHHYNVIFMVAHSHGLWITNHLSS
jgi:hypothetical protein